MSERTLKALINPPKRDTFGSIHRFQLASEEAVVAKVAEHFNRLIETAEKSNKGDLLQPFSTEEQYFLKEYTGVDHYQGMPVWRGKHQQRTGATIIEKDTYLVNAKELDESIYSALVNYGFDDAYSHVENGKLKAGDRNQSDRQSISQAGSMLWILESLGYKHPVWLMLGAQGGVSVTEFESFSEVLKYFESLQVPNKVDRRIDAIYAVGSFGLNIVPKIDTKLPRELKVKTRSEFEQQLKTFNLIPKGIDID